MTSPIHPSLAPAGDVATALIQVDSYLARIENPDTAEPTPALDDMIVSTLDMSDLVDGFCTLIYMFMIALRQAHEAADLDPVEGVLPNALNMLAGMKKSIAPEAIPTMAGLMTAAALNLSPSLWRGQYGRWRPEELRALEATAVVLALQINHHHGGDRSAAIRLVVDVMDKLDSDE